jgi:predicted hydrolase (HD superfamily)
MSLQLGRTIFGNPENTGNVLSRKDAMDIFHDWVKNERLKLHMLQVAWLMRSWAIEMEGASEAEAWKWEQTGLLHDADWDQWPEQHCRKIIEELENRGVDPEVIRAIASHGPKHFGVDPQSRMDKMLYAFDELSGLVHAYSLMRPEGYTGMELKGVRKRLKEKSFAANVNREEIADAAERAGISLDELIAFIVLHQPAAG